MCREFVTLGECCFPLQVGYGATETSPAVSSTRFVEDFENVMNGVMQLVEYAEDYVPPIEVSGSNLIHTPKSHKNLCIGVPLYLGNYIC
ncbi:hypothetical protein AVEN_191437-1 [Araneus ventricosus]|uniref:Uncharacterized protein n=1 Tax=Araneus ventricosus TaxID=182803 RepID=A0A4Y1ZVU5_ARAVE|nr:hypothetical protein AVEN_191437-1 [Araneus ventricosus]